MKLTVIIITYNQESFIAAAIEGALRQRTPFDFDVLVADDASTDGTRAIIARYEREHRGRVRTFLPERNLGRNGNGLFSRALALSDADYLAFCEGDDYWTDDEKLARAVELLDASPDLVGAFHAVDVVEGREATRVSIMRPHGGRASYHFAELVPTNFIPFSSTVYRRSRLEFEPFMNVLCGDWAFHLLHLQNGPIGYIDRVMGAYRQHDSGMWTTMAKSRRIEEEIAFTKMIPELFDFHDDRLLRRALASHWAELAVQRRVEGRNEEARDCARAALRASPLGVANAGRMAVGWTRITRAIEWRWKRARRTLVRRPATS